MKMAILSEEQAAIEKAHVEFVQGWSGRIAEWTIRAAAMRQEQAELEKNLTDASAHTVMQLIRLGYSMADAQERVEQLLELAFRKAPQ
jgi:Holliday junction resolvasome RuvABC DNA-binding subunit